MSLITNRDRQDEATNRAILDDAFKWRKLVRLAGTPANGSHTRVLLYWDDATNTRFIQVDNKNYYIEHGTFADILESIPDTDEELGLR